MTEIAQLFESTLLENRARVLRQAAMTTVQRMPGGTTLSELLASEAGDAVRELTLSELRDALTDHAPRGAPAARRTVVSAVGAAVASRTSEERVYRSILDALAQEPRTIGQLAKAVELPVSELRGYVDWMKKMGKIGSRGRARATRYHVLE